MHKTQAALSERNYGIDALRLLSMFFITLLHVLNHGGAASAVFGVKWHISKFSMLFLLSSVNCFGIISGYVSYTEHERPYKFSKYFTLWMQVVFYSFGITLLFYLFGYPKMTLKALALSIFPVSIKHYWYFTAYTGVFFIIPWLNKLVRRCSRTEMHKLVLCLFLLFSCYASVTSTFNLNSGYSFPWLAILYVIGAWMKKCAIADRISARAAAICIIVCSVLLYVGGVLFDFEVLDKYISPPVLLIAVSFVIIFSKIRFCKFLLRIIRFFTPAAFGVYLIHVHQIVWIALFQKRFVWVAKAPTLLYPFLVLLCAAAVFVVCLSIDRIRESLFRLLKINALGDRLFRVAANCTAKVFRRFHITE